ncbi:contractile injection system protein, VgrG/Pvc8 family [Caballeronia sp. SEWSISQ10-4 2]|uniref:contractile injection system protein, VgrG/Pvc8 family n=1 Tax=Caballeronia sp. SEWSISQ10-4 2 TaxID=2937438 RepID=UPI0026510616|nr:contractile injection system protein, VgrG/Pvc8 family [Caballeronia sp. SEWSISQ10-4 2]MDN7183251.1 contractile injection system protein, VgrG/Pvc8 family [Caballeronia sp. SEWSISQ10-4 2]
MSTSDMIGTTRIEKIDALAPAVFLHVALFLPGGVTIGSETFRATKISGQEKVSEPFEFQLELRANTSTKKHVPTLRFEQLIGRPVTFGIDRPDFRLPEDTLLEALTGASNDRFADALKGGGPNPSLSLFNGIVTAFSMSEPGVYKASVKPALWKLSLTNRYRVLVQKSVAQSIEMLMGEHGIRCSLAGIAGTHNLAQTRTQNWMQAGESDYALLQRLMGKAQIHYYFTHTGDTHTVMFSNTTHYPPIPFDRPLHYTSVDTSALGLTQADVVSQYTYEQSLVTSGVECVLARQQEAWDLDAIPTFLTYAAGPTDPGALPFTQYRQFQYGVSDWQARESASVADASRSASAERFTGASTCAQMRVGHRFTLSMPTSGTAGQPIQSSLDKQVFVLTEVSHEASLDGDYRNSFSATDQDGLITPFSIEQTQQGSVLATVVDADGSSTPKDWRYYTRQNFEMVTSDQIDRDASPTTLQAKGVYVNFATDNAANATAQRVWVKLAGHMQTVPEVGVTVIVARAQDESELPEIQSIVHANGTRAVSPSGWTSTTAIGNTFSTSYSDSQNIRFGAHSDVSLDSTLDQAIDTVTREYATQQYRETSYSQGASYSYSTSEQKEQGLLSRSLAYGSTHSQSWAAQQQNFSAVGSSYSENIVGQSSPALAQPAPSPAPGAVSVNLNTVYGDTHSESTNHGDTTSLSNVIGNSSSVNTVTGVSASYSTIEENQSTSVTRKSTSNNTTDISNNTNVVGTSIETSTTGSHTSVTTTGTSDTTSTTETSRSTTTTGKQDSTNTVRESTTVDMQGVTTAVTIAGATTRLNVSGASTDITISGMHSQVSMSASSHTISLAGPGIRINEDAESPEVNTTNATITIVGVIHIYL